MHWKAPRQCIKSKREHWSRHTIGHFHLVRIKHWSNVKSDMITPLSPLPITHLTQANPGTNSTTNVLREKRHHSSNPLHTSRRIQMHKTLRSRESAVPANKSVAVGRYLHLIVRGRQKLSNEHVWLADSEPVWECLTVWRLWVHEIWSSFGEVTEAMELWPWLQPWRMASGAPFFRGFTLNGRYMLTVGRPG